MIGRVGSLPSPNEYDLLRPTSPTRIPDIGLELLKSLHYDATPILAGTGCEGTVWRVGPVVLKHWPVIDDIGSSFKFWYRAMTDRVLADALSTTYAVTLRSNISGMGPFGFTITDTLALIPKDEDGYTIFPPELSALSNACEYLAAGGSHSKGIEIAAGFGYIIKAMMKVCEDGYDVFGVFEYGLQLGYDRSGRLRIYDVS